MKDYPIIINEASLNTMLETLRKADVQWERAMLVTDKKLHEVCVLLTNKESNIVAGFKPNMDADVFNTLYLKIAPKSAWLTGDLVEGLSVFSEGRIPDNLGVNKLTKGAMNKILKKPDRPKSTGRKGAISTAAARVVLLESCMRCMFKGCAKKLGEHSLTGEKGNFGYLAHIIPASENGPRGNEAIPGECERLVSDPSNIMLLCDECHRLVDRIAVSSFPRRVLEEMRSEFMLSADDSLNQLSFVSSPVAEFLWPIGTHHVGIPTPIEIQKSLAPLGIRWNGRKHNISDRNSTLNDIKTDQFWEIAPTLLKLAKMDLETLVEANPHLVLFAGGPMPALIALGALVGNKTKITPVLKARSSGGWCWLRDSPDEGLFSIKGVNELKSSSEVVLQLNLTFKTDQQEAMRKALEAEHGFQSILVEANLMGNECIAHHGEALSFQNEMTRLLTYLKSSHGVDRVHVLPCASNLLCVHFGRSVEQYSPALRIYDFIKSEDGQTSMYPVLDITPSNEGVDITHILDGQ